MLFFLREIERLKGRKPTSDEKEIILHDYIVEKLTPEEIEGITKGRYITPTKEFLGSKPVVTRLLKLIGVMELCDNWEEFEELQNKKNPPKQKELTGFDMLLKGLSQVPKPPKEKKPSK